MFETAVRDETALRSALAEADIAPMLMVLAQLSGDLDILHEVAPHIQGAWSFMETVPEGLKQKVRDRLVSVLRDYAATGREPPRDIPTDTLQQMMSAGVGQTVPKDYIPLLLEETGLDDQASRAVQWRRQPSQDTLDSFKVVIIGAGFSGLCTAIRLQDMGIPFEILEKNPEVGGTWLENQYPGCAVDTPNHFYSYSFNPNEKWTRHFSRRDEILAYINATADKFDLRRHIRFNAEVTRTAFNEATAQWQVTFRTAEGTTETIDANAVVTAIGQLNRPFIPPIAGIDRFQGPLFHTARWDPSVDLTGKRVAMIGTGASAMQTGPSIAPDVGKLLVFQRTRHWAANNPNYHKEVSAGNRWAIENIPYFAKWMRFQLFWAGSDGFHASLRMDPNWTQPESSLNEANHKMREMMIDHIRKELDGDEALLAKVVPPYPPYGKRMLRDNHWYRMLKALERRAGDRGDRPYRRKLDRDEGRRRSPGRRHHHGHRLHGLEDALANGHRRAWRPDDPRHLGRRRSARLSRDHRARLPQPVPDLRPEHQPGAWRQHHFPHGMPGPLHCPGPARHDRERSRHHRCPAGGP